MIHEVIPEVRVYWIPFDISVLLFHSIMYPIKVHVHAFGTFLFDSSSYDFIYC